MDEWMDEWIDRWNKMDEYMNTRLLQSLFRASKWTRRCSNERGRANLGK